MSVTQEICKIGNLEYYVEEISSIVKGIETYGFAVAPRYDIEISSIAWDLKIIRPSLKKGDRGLTTIWDLLHEYGHLLDGHPDTPSIEREINAWDYAKLEVLKYPKLMEFLDDFESRKEECLKSYNSQ